MMNNRLIALVAALTVGWLGACRSGVRQSSAIDTSRFEAVYQTGTSLETAVEVGVRFAAYRQALEVFADQVAIARNTAHTDQERRIAAMYDGVVDGYTDALTVWGTVDHMISPVMRIDRDAVAYARRSEFRRNDDSLFIPDERRTPQVVTVLARRHIPTIPTSNGNAISMAASLTVMWDAAGHDFDAANKTLESVASGQLP
jgi:hypothetical protein